MSAGLRVELHHLIDQLPEGELAVARRLLQALTWLGHDPRQAALGLLATDGPAPTDAEVEQWLDEHRRQKYG